MKFVIFHGSFGHTDDNWFSSLKEDLEMLSQEVIVPQFPVESWDEVTKAGDNFIFKNQSLENWLGKFEKDILPKLKKDEKLCFVGHSLGPIFILYLVEKYNIKLDCAIFVSPFLKLDITKGSWQIHAANKTFYSDNFDFEKLKKLIPLSYVLYSETDPYVDKNKALEFAQKMRSSAIPVISAGHMNSEVNLSEFPLVLELCKSRIGLNLYQKYLAHRRELFAVDYAGKPGHQGEEVIYLKPEEIFDEGVFKFRNLKKFGFCTYFPTIGGTWDPESRYFVEGRLAAKRIKDFTRVFVIRNSKDLENKTLLEQIRLDLENEVKVYLVDWEKIKDKVEYPDFGLWDGDYVCRISPREILLSSRSEDIKKAFEWRDEILKKAKRIEGMEDLTEIFKDI